MLVSCHIPKTAGVSFGTALQEVFGERILLGSVLVRRLLRHCSTTNRIPVESVATAVDEPLQAAPFTRHFLYSRPFPASKVPLVRLQQEQRFHGVAARTATVANIGVLLLERVLPTSDE